MLIHTIAMLVTLACGLGCAAPIPARTPAPTPAPAPFLARPSGKWKLIFSDEFSGNSLDTLKWSTCYWWDNEGCTNAGNNELQWYLPDNVVVSNGTLKLRAMQQMVNASDGKRYQYTSGMVTTGSATDVGDPPVKFACRMCYAEIRARVPSGKGLWPAFWLLPNDFTSKPEYDVLEILGDEPSAIHMAVHFLNEAGESDRAKQIWDGGNFANVWHTFAFDRREDALIWYVDGVERWRYTDVHNIPVKDMYLLLNLAVGGDWPGAPNAQTRFPADFEVDYVRVWASVDET